MNLPYKSVASKGSVGLGRAYAEIADEARNRLAAGPHQAGQGIDPLGRTKPARILPLLLVGTVFGL
jgi:hypothetical protein